MTSAEALLVMNADGNISDGYFSHDEVVQMIPDGLSVFVRARKVVI